jgi:hypothetical protein
VVSLIRGERTRAAISPEWELVLRGLQELAGLDRGVIYDVPLAEAPQPLRAGSIYVHGSPAWQRYLAVRRQLDTGETTFLLALRPLDEVERLLVVDWGTSYANAFLLVEPRQTGCDLTLADNRVRRALEQAARALLKTPSFDSATPGATRSTPLGELLRGLYGTWTYWSGPREARQVHRVDLAATAPEETLAGLIARHLPVRFPQGAFDRTVAELYNTERELFNGTVARARTPFRSRLGLPVLHEPRYVDRAMRRLVNEGRAIVYQRDENSYTRYGHGRPVPPAMPEEEFERFWF